MADTHDRFAATELAVNTLLEHGAEALFHCGDSMSEEIFRICSRILPFYFVAGNNDPSLRSLQKIADTLGIHFLGLGDILLFHGKTIALTHGHNKPLVRSLLQKRPDYLFLGHSHRRRDEIFHNSRIINPGALHRSASKSFALLDISTDHLQIFHQ